MIPFTGTESWFDTVCKASNCMWVKSYPPEDSSGTKLGKGLQIRVSNSE